MSNSLNQGLLEFIGAAPTPFHAVAELSQQLARAGYQRLDEREAWHCQAGSRYYVTRNDSSIIAFQLGNQPLAQSGLRLVGAHTDSPCLKLKPNPLLLRQGLAQLAVEVYGGALLAPWFDRDLSLAGRVSVIAEGRQHSLLLNFRQPIGVIPNLAIHLHRQANKGWEINPQNELPAIISQPGEVATISLAKLLAEQLQAEHGIAVESILDHELCLYDSQPPAQIGLQGEFIAAARLDNLLSCYAGLAALLAAGPDQNIALVCTDHEEIGSATACGADGPFLEQVVKRLVADEEAYVRCIQRSVLISADNAHAVHPNYADKHDGNHGPRLNGGPVIKVNSNQHYATNSDTASLFRQLCQQQQVPIQTFVTRSDMACGSTIGPITASRLGVATVDVGLPTLAMHSIRELAGAQDLAYLVQVLSAFYNSAQLL